MTGTPTDELYDITWYTKRNANMPHDVIKPNDAGKIACPQKIVQHIFIDSLFVSMLEWK